MSETYKRIFVPSPPYIISKVPNSNWRKTKMGGLRTRKRDGKRESDGDERSGRKTVEGERDHDHISGERQGGVNELRRMSQRGFRYSGIATETLRVWESGTLNAKLPHQPSAYSIFPGRDFIRAASRADVKVHLTQSYRGSSWIIRISLFGLNLG